MLTQWLTPRKVGLDLDLSKGVMQCLVVDFIQTVVLAQSGKQRGGCRPNLFCTMWAPWGGLSFDLTRAFPPPPCHLRVLCTGLALLIVNAKGMCGLWAAWIY
jgi:hypothetical protein